MDYNQYRVINPEMRFGVPIIKGTRIAVSDVLQWLKTGMTAEEILFDFPEIEYEQINACIEFDKQQA